LTKEKLLLATTNQGKVREIRDILEGLPIEVLSLEDVLPETPYRERGMTFRENARAKSVYFSRKSGFFTLAEDSGIEIDALGGLPGVRSARFSSPRPSDDKNNRKVLNLLEGLPRKDRKARFVCVLVLSRKGRTVKEIRGEVRGLIAFEPKGGNGFGYDPLFYYPPLRRTFAELDLRTKNRVSHRGRALGKLKKYLSKHLPK
jgi:XTP/dITP diphosphohydrolase